MVKKSVIAVVVALAALFIVSSFALASVPPGQKGYEGQPGNQGNGQLGYEGQPGNQGGNFAHRRGDWISGKIFRFDPPHLSLPIVI